LNSKFLYPASWKDYQLIDSGNFEKLERFGNYKLIRPEPQAIWQKVLSDETWDKLADARFTREQSDSFRLTDEVKGGWTRKSGIPESWQINYQHNRLTLALRLALTGFGHVGIFPEQGENWNFIFDAISSWNAEKPKILNLFAYTGAASVVAKSAGADVTHVDASRPGLNWAKQNMLINGLSDIRWVHEDALKFVKREVKRGNRYQGIIMDPPPYGRGPEGEKWTLQEKLNELIYLSSQLLETNNSFFILSMYAVGLSPLVGQNIVNTHFEIESPEYGEFYLKSENQMDLPMGTFSRFNR
jgi:23S rRNA (cytosine1962-C5)-methyltransferase